MTREERICKYLSACPAAIAGQNGHTQTFTVACNLYNGFAMSQSELEYWLKQYNDRCVPPWNEHELAHKVEQAMKAQHSRKRGCLMDGDGKYGGNDYLTSSFEAKQKTEPKPTIDPVTAIETFLKGHKCEEPDLWEASVIKPSDDWRRDGATLVSALFRPDEFVNYVIEYNMTKTKDGAEKPVPMGKGVTVSVTEAAEDWSAFGTPTSDVGGWMRINPMAQTGVADKDVTAFRHLLLEFDTIPLELQLSFFSRLPLPVSAILTSGGKSVHAWVKVDCNDLTDYKDTATMIFKYLSRFGVDLQNKNPSRLSRLAGAQRKIGAHGDGRQRILYLNPNPKQEPILCR